MTTRRVWLGLCLGMFAAVVGGAEPLPKIRVADDQKSFIGSDGRPFAPWGFNYDRDAKGRLLEDYWTTEWAKVEADFAAMKQLGANVVRIHLQTAKFLDAADRPNAKALAQLQRLLAVAEKERLYLDITGLGCYHKRDVPAWYDELDEAGRWQAQAVFWSAIAQACAASPAVFCYDLMNEPVVPAGDGPKTDWLGPAFGDKHYVQRISLTQRDRKRPAIGKAWIQTLSAAIRRHDRGHLITVGLVDWSLERPGLQSGFVPREIAPELDFICVHLYPEKDKLPAALETLAGFAVGKPVVIEETFPLKCSANELRTFFRDSRKTASGWIGFYWGTSTAELRKSQTIGDALTLAWLEMFQAATPDFRQP